MHSLAVGRFGAPWLRAEPGGVLPDGFTCAGDVLGLSALLASADGGRGMAGDSRFPSVGFFRMLVLGDGDDAGDADGPPKDSTDAPENETDGRRGD